jgi:hypothetical protein
VAEFEVDNDWHYNRPETRHTKYTWAKNVGLIKQTLLEHASDIEIEAWNLIECSVSQ